MENDPRVDQLGERIIGCAMAVHNALVPGLLESIYRDCLIMELLMCGLTADLEVHVPVEYRGKRIRDDLRLDLLVEGRIIVEVKSVAAIHPVRRSGDYLRETGEQACGAAPEFQRDHDQSRSAAGRSP